MGLGGAARPARGWGWGGKAYLLVGALAHSGKWRGVLAESTDQPHLIDALDRVARALGGLTRPGGSTGWPPSASRSPGGSPRRSPRSPSTTGCPCDLPAAARQPQGRGGEGQPHRGATVVAHPGRRRHARAGPGAAGRLVRPARRRPAARGRGRQGHRRHDRRARAAAPAPPAPFPAICRSSARSPRRRWSPSAATATRSRPSWPGPRSRRACRLGASHLDIATAAGTVIARHPLAPAGAGVMVRDHGHVMALEHAAMAAASPAAPHRRKQRIPPGPAARAAAAALRAAAGTPPRPGEPSSTSPATPPPPTAATP